MSKLKNLNGISEDEAKEILIRNYSRFSKVQKAIILNRLCCKEPISQSKLAKLLKVHPSVISKKEKEIISWLLMKKRNEEILDNAFIFGRMEEGTSEK